MTTEELVKDIDEVNISKYLSLWEAGEDLEARGYSKVAENIDLDRHRWYELSTSIFKYEENYIGIRGVSNIYSESMAYDDVCYSTEAFEVELIPSVTYKRK
jgi:hypothetical protein